MPRSGGFTRSDYRNLGYNSLRLWVGKREVTSAVSAFYTYEKISAQDLHSTLARHGKAVQMLAKRFAPKVSGCLADNIDLILTTRTFEVGWDRSKFVTDHRSGGRFYAPYVELGTRNAPAQPMISRAFNQLMDRYRQDYARALQRAAHRLAQKRRNSP